MTSLIGSVLCVSTSVIDTAFRTIGEKMIFFFSNGTFMNFCFYWWVCTNTRIYLTVWSLALYISIFIYFEWILYRFRTLWEYFWPYRIFILYNLYKKVELAKHGCPIVHHETYVIPGRWPPRTLQGNLGASFSAIKCLIVKGQKEGCISLNEQNSHSFEKTHYFWWSMQVFS